MPVAPPRPKGPPLGALRAFEAAARLGSFAAAAEELSVTAGAVSQQIKQVETWAETQLFKRRAHGVSLSPAGKALYPKLEEAFEAIGEATRILRSLSPRPSLNIATLPSIAQLWLQPRLPRLRAERPDLLISVSAIEAPPDLQRGLFDCSLFFAPIGGEGIALAPDRLFPVCAPEIAARLNKPKDIFSETLIVDDSWSEDWPDWLALFGLRLPPDIRIMRHSLYSLALADALAGQGILMGHAPLIEQELAVARLIAPFETVLDRKTALMLRQPHGQYDAQIEAALRTPLSR